MTLTGVFPVLSTPFTADNTIDSDALGAEVEWLRGSGVDGLTVAMVSEVLRLSDDERRWLTTRACALAADSTHALPVVISVGTPTVAGSIALAEHAEAAGAAAVMTIPPLGVRLDDAGLIGFFTQILRAVGLPVVVQDASGYVGDPIGLNVYHVLLDEF
jgi:2-keto-3-deoxy-L-arabinonate dehydratase